MTEPKVLLEFKTERDFDMRIVAVDLDMVFKVEYLCDIDGWWHIQETIGKPVCAELLRLADENKKLKERVMELEGILDLSQATAKLNREHPLPRCTHGVALRDHAGNILEPDCGCYLATGCRMEAKP